jgi:hypothetical protein
LGLDPADKAALASALDSVAKTTINVLFPVVKFRLYYSKPKAGGAQYIDLDAGLDVVVGIQLDTTQNPVAGTVKALSAVAILQDATVESIMNNAIIPTFLPDLNEVLIQFYKLRLFHPLTCSSENSQNDEHSYHFCPKRDAQCPR